MSNLFGADWRQTRMIYPWFHPEGPPPPLLVTDEEFRQAFPAEGQYVEFKAGVSRTTIEEVAVAFSNAYGGVLLLGVDDAGQIRGCPIGPAVEADVHGAMASIRNPGRYQVHQLLVGNGAVRVVSIAKRVQGFAQTASGRVLLRRGASNQPLFDAELRRFITERSLERFESSDSGVPLETAGSDLVRRLAEAFGWFETGVAERLFEQGLTTRSASSANLTVAGALYLLTVPSDRLGKCFIEVLRFPGIGSDYDRRTEFRGPLNEQVEHATNAIIEEIGSDLIVLGLRRYDLPRLPPVVVREAMANAVAHRSYELNGVAIRVEIRSDAVRIISPGPLPEPVTVGNIREAQSARNPAVIAVLRRLRLAEDAGRGVDVMQDEMQAELLDPPNFVDTGHSVEVTLPVRSGVSPRERAWLREIEARGDIMPADRLLLVHAARGEVLTNARAREILQTDRDEARRALQRLRDAALVVQMGERGGASYHLNESLAPPAGLRLRAEQIAEMVERLALEHGRVTNAMVRERTGLDRLDALRVLDDLVVRGRLVRRGERRGAHYVPTVSR